LCSDHLIQPQARRVCEFPETNKAFLASLSQNERYQHRKRSRKLEQDFSGCEIELFATPETVDRLMQDAETIAKTSYQRGLGVGFAQTPIIQARLDYEARIGWLRAYVLYLNKQPAAFWIGSFRNRTFLSDYLAFDPTYAQYGPGLYLMVKVMEELHDDTPSAAKCIDFGIGDAIYKERLSNRNWLESPVYIFAPNAKGMGVNILRSAVGALSGLAKRTSLPGAIKRRWRRHLTGKELKAKPK